MTATSVTGIGPGAVDIPTNKQLGDEVLLMNMFGRNVFFVGKNGNDSNDGLSFFTPFSTFSHAIEKALEKNPSSTYPYVIVCLDAGVYPEIIIGSPWIDIFAPNAILLGAIVIANETRTVFNKVINTGTEILSPYGGLDGVAIQRVFPGGDSHIELKELISNGGAGILNLNPGSELFVKCQQITVNSGVGIGTADVAVPGHMHLHIEMISLSSSGTVGIGAFENQSEMLGSIDHIVPDAGITDTVGVYCKNGTMHLNFREILTTYGIQMGDGLLNINCNYLSPTQANNLTLAPYVISGGELNMFINKMTGTPINTGGTVNVSIAGM